MPDTAEQFRAAIVSQDYARAGELWKLYAAALEDSIRNGAASEAEMREARELVEWSRLMVLAARAHAQSRLEQVKLVSAYAPGRTTGPRLVRTSV